MIWAGLDLVTYSWDFNDATGAAGYTFRLSTVNNAQSSRSYSVQVSFTVSWIDFGRPRCLYTRTNLSR